jgi:hypothetical protein
VGGALVLAYLNSRRDREERNAKERAAQQERAAARCAALQELLIELGDAHRRLKVVKRQMRSQIRRAEDRTGEVAPPYSIRADAFERAMDALLNAQIAAEEVRDLIAIRTDLLDEAQILRIRKALRYGARYFHDVYQDYEHCRVDRDDEHYVVTPGCRNLSNFLLAKRPPSDLPPEQAQELEDQFNRMKNDDRPLADRHDALQAIEKLRQCDPARRRYRVVATECFALAADEIRAALSCESRYRVQPST